MKWASGLSGIIMSFSISFLGVDFAFSQETYKDIISKAKNLSLQKDRLQATKILIRAAQKERGSAKKELIQTLQELSELFYTEKGQQLFELGQSLKFTALSTSIERYQEALQLEPSNVEVLRALTRAHLTLGACERSLEFSQMLLDSNPFDEEHTLLRLQSIFCGNQVAATKETLETADVKRVELKIYFDMMRAQALITEEKLTSAEQLLEKIVLQDKAYPESFLLLANLKKRQKKDFLEPAKKYLDLCKGLNPQTRTKYRFEPRLCTEEKKVEAEVEESETKRTTGV
jgi:tetratricopeptide (TPR) repeat protein